MIILIMLPKDYWLNDAATLAILEVKDLNNAHYRY